MTEIFVTIISIYVVIVLKVMVPGFRAKLPLGPWLLNHWRRGLSPWTSPLPDSILVLGLTACFTTGSASFILIEIFPNAIVWVVHVVDRLKESVSVTLCVSFASCSVRFLALFDVSDKLIDFELLVLY